MNASFTLSNTFRWIIKVCTLDDCRDQDTYAKQKLTRFVSLSNVQADPVDKVPIVLEVDGASGISPIKSKDFDVNVKASLPKSALPQHGEESHEPDKDPVDDTPESLQDMVVNGKIDPKQVTLFLHDMYTSHIVKTQEEEEISTLEVVLEASSLLVNEFAMVSASETVLETIQRELDEYIFPRIALLYTDISTIEASNVAKLISFSDLYNDTLLKRGMEVPKDRLADFEELCTEYLRRGVHDQMQLMIANSLRLREKEEIKRNRHGHLVTGHPEDISFMIEMQIAVAREHLPARFVGEVLTACNQELFNMTADIMLDVGSRWSDIEVERFCAIINDASRMIEQCENRNEALLDPSHSEHQKAGDDLCRELTELSLHATRFLCERIMFDLREPNPILTRVGGTSWETGALLVSETTVATLKDYVDDISEWIPDDYYFPKFLQHCFHMTLQTYFESLFAMTLSTGIKDPEVASRVLQQDWQNFHQFFCSSGMAGYIGRAGHYTKDVMESRLGLLLSISLILTPTLPPTKLKSEINALLMQFGAEVGITAILHLAGLRNRHIAQKEATEWRTVIQEEMQAFEASKAKPPYTLPDLRNSEYIVRVATVKQQNAVDEDSTLTKLSQRPGLGKRWRASVRASRRRMLKSDRTLISTWKTPPENEMWQAKPTLSKQAQSEYKLVENKLAPHS
jgi:hypothetical protein